MDRSGGNDLCTRVAPSFSVCVRVVVCGGGKRLGHKRATCKANNYFAYQDLCAAAAAAQICQLSHILRAAVERPRRINLPDALLVPMEEVIQLSQRAARQDTANSTVRRHVFVPRQLNRSPARLLIQSIGCSSSDALAIMCAKAILELLDAAVCCDAQVGR